MAFYPREKEKLQTGFSPERINRVLGKSSPDAPLPNEPVYDPATSDRVRSVGADILPIRTAIPNSANATESNAIIRGTATAVTGHKLTEICEVRSEESKEARSEEDVLSSEQVEALAYSLGIPLPRFEEIVGPPDSPLLYKHYDTLRQTAAFIENINAGLETQYSVYAGLDGPRPQICVWFMVPIACWHGKHSRALERIAPFANPFKPWNVLPLAQDPETASILELPALPNQLSKQVLQGANFAVHRLLKKLAQAPSPIADPSRQTQQWRQAARKTMFALQKLAIACANNEFGRDTYYRSRELFYGEKHNIEHQD